MRPIDADELLKHKRKMRGFGFSQEDEYWEEAVLVSEIENCPTISCRPLTTGKWVDCNERLPDEECVAFKERYGEDEVFEVLVMISGAEIATTLYYDLFSGNFVDADGDIYSVTHWMALPESPSA